MPDLRQRRREPEIMDQPGLDPQHHFQALTGLRRINFLSGSARILWPPIRDLATADKTMTVRVLDVATGGGDVPVRLWQKARRAGLNIEVTGCDFNAQAVGYAAQQARARQADVSFFPLDALHAPLPNDYDVLTTSLFLHHLEEEQAVSLLTRMAMAARRLVLVNDLIRCRPGYALAFVGTRLLSTSRVVHVDGLLSVAAAFTTEEVLGLARRAGMEGATIGWRWPFRFLLSWRRPG